MGRFIGVLLILVSSVSTGRAEQLDARVQRGETLAMNLCAECHAIRGTEQSPHAGAPAFHILDRRLDLDSFLERLRRGLTSGHPDMPAFRFTRDDARALIAYLRSIQRI